VIIVSIMAARLAPRRLAAKVKLRLPKAMPLKARSAQLSVKQILPSSRKRANSSQRLSMQSRLWDLGGAGEGFALAQQPGVHVLEKRLALFLAHGAPLVSVPAIDGAFDLEQRMEVSDRSSAIGETVCSAPNGRPSGSRRQR